MVRSLWTAATGMNGQQANMDVISNNLSNVNTTGYKQQRVEFEDLIYQNVKLAGTPATEDTVTPVFCKEPCFIMRWVAASFTPEPC